MATTATLKKPGRQWLFRRRPSRLQPTHVSRPVLAAEKRRSQLHSLNPSSTPPPSTSLNRSPRARSAAPLPADFQTLIPPAVVAAAPTEADWSAPQPTPSRSPNPLYRHPYDSTSSHHLHGRHRGDFNNGHLLDDKFADGRPWLVGLTRFTPHSRSPAASRPLHLPTPPQPTHLLRTRARPKPDTPAAACNRSRMITQYTSEAQACPTATQKKVTKFADARCAVSRSAVRASLSGAAIQTILAPLPVKFTNQRQLLRHERGRCHRSRLREQALSAHRGFRPSRVAVTIMDFGAPDRAANSVELPATRLNAALGVSGTDCWSS